MASGLRERYRGTSRALHDAASREEASTGWKVSCPPSGGYFLWIELPADCDERGVTRAAEDAGVAFLPGSRCVPRPRGPREERSCRLCFAYLDEEKIVEGVKRPQNRCGTREGSEEQSSVAHALVTTTSVRLARCVLRTRLASWSSIESNSMSSSSANPSSSR